MSPLGSPTEPTPSPPPAPSPACPPVVPDRPTPCVKCGYDLRTLPIASVCPECSAPVQTSLVPIIRMDDNDWKMFLRGLRLVRLANCSQVALAFAALGAAQFQGWFSIGAAVLLAIGIPCTAFPRSRGYTLIAESAPHAVGDAARDRARRRLSICARVRLWLNFALTWMVVVLALNPGPVIATPVVVLSSAIIACMLLATVVQFQALCSVLDSIALSEPSASIAKLRYDFMLVLPIFFVILLPVYGIGIPVAWLLHFILLSLIISEARRRVARSASPAPV